VIRRSFRFGLTLGLLGGLAFALVKMFGTRPDTQPAAAPSPTAPWPRLTADPAVPAAPTTSLVVDPDAPASPAHAAAFEAPTSSPAIEDPAPSAPPVVAAPAPTDAPPADPEPVATPVAKRAAPKKAAPKKPAAGRAPAAKTAKTAKKKPLVAPWVDPAEGVCPTTHPVKGKLASKIFHLPGMLNYARTAPDRCYRDASAAEADGLRQAKR